MYISKCTHYFNRWIQPDCGPGSKWRTTMRHPIRFYVSFFYCTKSLFFATYISTMTLLQVANLLSIKCAAELLDNSLEILHKCFPVAIFGHPHKHFSTIHSLHCTTRK